MEHNANAGVGWPINYNGEGRPRKKQVNNDPADVATYVPSIIVGICTWSCRCRCPCCEAGGGGVVGHTRRTRKLVQIWLDGLEPIEGVWSLLFVPSHINTYGSEGGRRKHQNLIGMTLQL